MEKTIAIVIALPLSALIFAVIFWGSICILDRGNPRNKFSLAVFFGFLFALFSMLPGSFILGFIPLAAIFLLLLNFYQLGLLKILAIIFILTATSLFLAMFPLIMQL